MRVARLVVSVFFVLVAGPFASAFAQGAVDVKPQCGGTTLTNNLYRFCYDGTKWLVDEPSNVRFTNRDRVEVEVMHLNYFKYTLSFDIQEQKSEAYQFLTKLWTSALGVGFGSFIGSLEAEAPDASASDDEKVIARRKAAAERLFVDHVRELLRYSEALDARLTGAIGAHRKPGLNKGELTTLTTNLGTDADPCTKAWTPGKPDGLLNCSVLALDRDTAATFYVLEHGVHTDADQFAVATNKYGEIYDAAKKGYAAVKDRAEQFASIAARCLSTETRKVGKREAGTKITLLVAAVDGANRLAIGDVSYFVETTMPLVVHGGLAFSKLNDVTFEKVKRASAFSEEDLFQKTGENANSRNFSLFMGWRLANLDGRQPNTSRFALLASLGTDVDAPGKKLYIGPTLVLFNRFAVTYGAALGKESDGEQVTFEPDVFRIIKAKPSAAQFFSITTKVF